MVDERQNGDAMNNQGLRQCPFCKESIRAEALKCRYCGEWLSESLPNPAGLPAEMREVKPPPLPASSSAVPIPPLHVAQPLVAGARAGLPAKTATISSSAIWPRPLRAPKAQRSQRPQQGGGDALERWIVRRCRQTRRRQLLAWSVGLPTGLVLCALYIQHTDTEFGRKIAAAHYVGIALGFVLLVLAGLAVLSLLLQLGPLHDYPVVTRIRSWGNPLTVAAEIEREFLSPQAKRLSFWTLADRILIDQWILTENYIIHSSFFTFDVLRFPDLLWAYKRVTKRSLNFISTGTDYAVNLACYGGTAVIGGSEEQIGEILQHAAKRAPWAAFGFSKDIERRFTEQAKDFCLAVEARKEGMLRQVVMS